MQKDQRYENPNVFPHSMVQVCYDSPANTRCIPCINYTTLSNDFNYEIPLTVIQLGASSHKPGTEAKFPTRV